jgi:23S rRNA (cytosine1962-C5)-methyltransferase
MSSTHGTIILKKGREKPVIQRHPWIFSGAIHSEEGEAGGLVTVRDQTGRFLAQGYYNPRSQIRARLLTWDERAVINTDWWRARLAQAIEARAGLIAREDLTACRLIWAESDGLPGLVVDRYGEWLVLQSLTLGIETHKAEIAELLADLCKSRGIYERSDADVRPKEGLEESTGVLWGEAPPESIRISEYGLTYPVDVTTGHKTGFYLDQRESRRWLLTAGILGGASVLNAFSYTGAFSACAARAGARQIMNVDTSQPALEMARQTMEMNGFEGVESEYVAADVFQQLRVFRDQNRSFDVILLDPPKFAHSAAEVDRAARGYKDINLLAFQLLRPGGWLITFSCSGQVSPDLFQKIVFGASIDAGRQAHIAVTLGQGEDHPVLLTFPEGRYLKGLACAVRDFE